ncbi:hypothetical protein BpHYR1_026362 [Brachionus plicatilis]|uniref:Uncharacterized protein n=1 Tax=Brachionus plicatilis TaxID=10195 RepID=A0A3M7T2L2_BRAPC|nr:hypothetical protein BpHYR1_026362 [Brachionus plicatilis]
MSIILNRSERDQQNSFIWCCSIDRAKNLGSVIEKFISKFPESLLFAVHQIKGWSEFALFKPNLIAISNFLNDIIKRIFLDIYFLYKILAFQNTSYSDATDFLFDYRIIKERPKTRASIAKWLEQD